MGMNWKVWLYYVFDTIMKNDSEIHRELFANIVFSGGNTMFPGMRDHLQKDIASMAPSFVKVKVIAPDERKYSVWMGGVYSCLPFYIPKHVDYEGRL
jgi:actin-related protein